MKPQTIAAALITAALATSAFADADHDDPESGAPTTQVPQQGKTREQVVQELIQARRDGLLPGHPTEYPPSQATIDRNRALMRAADPTWASQ